MLTDLTLWTSWTLFTWIILRASWALLVWITLRASWALLVWIILRASWALLVWITLRASWVLLHIIFLFSRCLRHVKWNRNITSLLLISRLEKSIFSMSKIKKSSSSLRRRQQLNSLSIDSLAMRFCKNCTQTSKQCRVAKNCEKCVKCVRSNRFCDLISLNTARWRRLKEQRRKFKIELKESFAKQQRLLRQIDYVKKKQRVMMNEKLRNIEKLKKTKHRVVDEKVDSLIDVISKQIVFFNDLDEWYFISFFSFDDNFEVFSNNSWDCWNVFMCCLR